MSCMPEVGPRVAPSDDRLRAMAAQVCHAEACGDDATSAELRRVVRLGLSREDEARLSRWINRLDAAGRP